jgi:hypothetical protein
MDFLGFGTSGRAFESHERPRRIRLVQKRSTFIVVRNQNHGNAIGTNRRSLSGHLSNICETFGKGIDRHIIPILILEFGRFQSRFLDLCTGIRYRVRRFGEWWGSTDEACHDTADALGDFVDVCDGGGIEEFVGDFFLTDDDGGVF